MNVFGKYDMPVLNKAGEILIEDKESLVTDYCVESFLVNKFLYFEIKQIVKFVGQERHLKLYHHFMDYLRDKG
jgi:hypothetical protein